RNVTQASSGSRNITGNVRDAAATAREIAASMEPVRQAVADVLGMSAQLNQRADEMSRLSESIKGIVARFRLA
ncbi:MAG: hypothetical protein HQL97_17025, partial [Magnetococcales bacterium]|nr:hypothetical protein [Magnetococcales bacterium]